MMPPYTCMLTEEHLEWISQERAEWLRAGLSTEPVDRPAAEAAVRRVYETAGLQPPRVVWADSPYGCVLAGAMLQQNAHRDQLGKQLWREFWHQLRERLRDQLGDQLWETLGGQLGNHVVDPLWKQLRGAIGSQIQGQLRDQLGDRNPGAARSLVSASLATARDAGGTAFCALASRIAGLPAEPRLDALVDASRRFSWWLPLQGVAIVSERPLAIHRDDQGRLHNSDGPAVAYPDGWGVWAWHGVRVKPWVITDPTPEAIASEPNVEVRRAAIEVLGWDAYIRQVGLALVGEADDPGNPGQQLALYDMPEQVYGAPVRVLLCTNGTVERDGTRRRYGLTVPATIIDPVEAAGWTYGLRRDQYAQLRRRT